VKSMKADARRDMGNTARNAASRTGAISSGGSKSRFSIDDLDPHECVAALADSALGAAEAQIALDRLLKSPELCASWHRLHQASDYLRSEEMADCEARPGFWDDFSARLGNEPTVFAPNRAGAFSMRGAWARYGLRSASALAAVAVVGWIVIPQYRGEPSGSGVIASNGTAQQQIRANVQPAPEWDRLAHENSDPGAYAGAVPARASDVAYEYAELDRYLGAHLQYSPRHVRGPVGFEPASFNLAGATEVASH